MASLSSENELSELYGFGGSDGLYPASVITDGRGNYYGTTMWGGDFGRGAIFKLSTRTK